MKFKIIKQLIIVLSVVAGTYANAGLIDHTTYTEDTTNNVAFLDFGLIGSGDYAALDITAVYGGYNWELATADQFTAFITEITGVTIPAWTGTNLTDIDLSSTQITDVLNYLNASQTGHNDYYVKGGYGWIHHEGWDDMHIYNSTNQGTRQGIYVRSTDVPEPSTLAIFALGMIGLASRRFKK